MSAMPTPCPSGWDWFWSIEYVILIRSSILSYTYAQFLWWRKLVLECFYGWVHGVVPMGTGRVILPY